MPTRIILPLLLALAVSACAPMPVSREEAPASTPGGRTDVPEPGPSAVLLEQGRTQYADGEYPAAAATLERAIRIEPANPWLWIELARVHLATGNGAQAEAHARKALSLAGTDDAARRAAEAVLTRSRN